MKTILVVYSHARLTKKEYVGLKTYAFNTRAKLKVGDRIKTDDYTAPLQVVEVLPRAHKYVNTANGALSDKRDSTRQFELRELIIQPKPVGDNVVYGSLEGAA